MDANTLADELEALAAKATAGEWQLQDGCSWRRIGTRMHDGNVLCPSVYSESDRHPDLVAGKGQDVYANLKLIVALKNNLPSILAALRAREPSDERVAWVGRALAETHLDFQEEPLSMNATREDIDRLARAALRAMENNDAG